MLNEELHAKQCFMEVTNAGAAESNILVFQKWLNHYGVKDVLYA